MLMFEFIVLILTVNRTSKVDPTPKLGQEEDVANEPNRIVLEELNAENFVLKTENLTKVSIC